MRKIKVIGIGAGHPEHITIQAIKAINDTDVLFITDKGADKDDLAAFRREIIERYAPDRQFRIVQIADDHLGALLQEAAHRRQTDARAATGDYGDPPVETSRHVCSLHFLVCRQS